MKFQGAAAFEKHLKESFPDHLSRLFLLISPCDYEKRLWAEKIVELFRKKDLQLTFSRFDATEVSLIHLQDEIRSPSLWGGTRLFLIDAIDKVKPLGPYLDLLDHIPSDVVLIFCAAAAKPIGELYLKEKKEIIAIDVSEEKPWDRDRRLQEWLRDEARKVGKQLSTEVAAEILRNLGSDLATLDQELKKLITYVGAKASLDKTDVEAICGSHDLVTGWQLAETLVWKNPVSIQEKMSDPSFVFPFFGQLRYHLQIGAQLAGLLEKKVSSADLKKYLPSIRPQNLDKWIPIAKQRTSKFFLQGLLRLYELELSAKSTSLDLGVMFDIFQIKIYENCSL